MTTEKRAKREQPRPRTTSPGRPPNSEVAARLRHVLAVASAEFIHHGYAEANVARIAQDAGVSKKTIYARYPTKADLLVAVVSDLATGYHERVIAAMCASAGDLRDVLRSFGTQAAHNWASVEAVGVYRLIVSEAARFPELSTIYRDTMHQFRTTLSDYLEKQCKAGKLDIADTYAASHQFGWLIYGEIREKRLLGETVTDDDIDAVVERAVRVFLTGFEIRPPRRSRTQR